MLQTNSKPNSKPDFFTATPCFSYSFIFIGLKFEVRRRIGTAEINTVKKWDYVCFLQGQAKPLQTSNFKPRSVIMQLTKNFTLKELTVTSVDAPNDPRPSEIIRLRMLAKHILQPLRDRLGRPVIINSAYRSPQVNKIVGGVPTSQHSMGEAADIRVPGMHPLELAQYIRDSRLPFDQLIREPSWVHVSFGPRHRRQLLTMRAGKYTNGLS